MGGPQGVEAGCTAGCARATSLRRPWARGGHRSFGRAQGLRVGCRSSAARLCRGTPALGRSTLLGCCIPRPLPVFLDHLWVEEHRQRSCVVFLGVISPALIAWCPRAEKRWSLMMVPGPRHRPRTRVGGWNLRPRLGPSALECPSPVRLAAGTGLLWCRHGALSAPGVQNGGDQPGQHAARRRKHQVIAWFLGDAQAIEALISSVLDTSGPTAPANRPHRHAAPTETTNPSGATRRGP